MKQSQLFTKIRKEVPAGEVSKNAQLLIQAGFVYKEMAGVYAYLPLGWRVMNKIIEIIREEMNAIGGQELFLTALQSKEIWEKSGRWSDEVIDVWFKSQLASGTDVGLGNTHEEPITALMKQYVHSHKDLPVFAYQFQTKFRNELRAKSGIMRSREFIMKDLYSFCKNDQQHEKFYEECKQAYTRIFERLGIGDKTFVTFASGGSFSKYSHEFQALSDAGEDIIYLSRDKNIAVNEEVYNDEVLAELNLKKQDLEQHKAIEVGNIFSLGTKFSDALDLTYIDESGEKQKVIMGSYGIGPGRAMGTIVELCHDEHGIVWPESVAPFRVHLISLLKEGGGVADQMYKKLTDMGVETLYDDRDERAGVKFAQADMIGIPYRVVISEKTLEKNAVEVKKRNESEARLVLQEELYSLFV
ncbi:prolyl-tRNA synthetase [Candidatus Nomurabacteria bacterium]|nr:prolyl-tRNA synthetase [Candidatus Nomurabacteria bacterium]